MTIRLASGSTATYAVIASSDIVKDGVRVSLSAIKVGEAVFLHVYPLNGRTVVEHLFAEDRARMIEEFREELYSARFDARRIDI